VSPPGSFEVYGLAPTRDVPFPTLIAEVTPEEFAELPFVALLSDGHRKAGEGVPLPTPRSTAALLTSHVGFPRFLNAFLLSPEMREE